MTQPVKIGDATLLTGDVIECLQTLPAESVHCVVTSPPYWGLRDYGTATWEGGDADCDHKPKVKPRTERPACGLNSMGYIDDCQQPVYRDTCKKCGAKRIDKGIGLEPTFQEWLDRMVAVMREVRRVLRKDGTVWLNIGDAYANSSQPGGGDPTIGKRNLGGNDYHRKPLSGFKPKDLLMMPARLALALQADGWWVRSDIIWSKPNPMPESVTDRPTSAHEHIFLLTKASRYFYDADAVRESAKDWGTRDRSNGKYHNEGTGLKPHTGLEKGVKSENGRNIRNVWTIATQPYPEAHFATFPEALPLKCIMAGTSERGCCPECGSPWGRVVERDFMEQNNCSDIKRMGGDGHRYRARGSNNTKTLGWQPTCGCNTNPKRNKGEGYIKYRVRMKKYEPIPCTVLDPFSGSATTGLVALKLSRRYIGIELNPEYQQLAIKRITAEASQRKLF